MKHVHFNQSPDLCLASVTSRPRSMQPYFEVAVSKFQFPRQRPRPRILGTLDSPI
jgi:hypothetical protein